jgi:hypothetical protein
MATSVDQRDMTLQEVTAMPASLLRDLLLSSFTVQQATAQIGAVRNLPLLCQYLGGPRLGTGAFAAPILLANPEGLAAHQVLNTVIEEMEDGIDWWDEAVHPLARGDGALLAVSAVYDDWVLPDSHPADDPRDPADVPNAVATRFVRGVTPDGIAFLVSGPVGGEMTARVGLVDNQPVSIAGYSVDRHAAIQQNLQRFVGILRTAYAHTFTDPATYPPPYEPDPSPVGFATLLSRDTAHDTEDAIKDDTTAAAETTAGAGKTAQNGEGLTPAQIQDFDNPTLRWALLRMFDFEAGFQREVGWNTTPCIIFRHCRHGTTDHQCYVGHQLEGSVGPATKFALFRADLLTRNLLRIQPELIEGTYLGVALMLEVAELNDGALALAAAATSSAQVRVIVGMMREGTCFMLVRRRGYRPAMTVVADLGEAATKFGPQIMDHIRVLNDAFVDLDTDTPATDTPATDTRVTEEPTVDAPSSPEPEPIPSGAVPNAPLSELPPEDPMPTTLGVVTVRTLWQDSAHREGKIYPPLPPIHPFAARPCLCGQPLSNGLPVQTYVLMPVDATAAEALRAGLPSESVSVLAHQQCVPAAGHNLKNDLMAVYRTIWGKHHG